MSVTTPAAGELIGDYEILEQIGGNMGFVFKARHRLLDKVVALKLVPAEWMADPARLARFQREVRIMGQLAHPNLVTAADARIVDNWQLVAMELIDGVDLQQLIRIQGSLPVTAACEAIRQAALGLQHAHEHGLIHRDIKPSNLMLTRSGILKVIDMGLALIREDSTAQLTQTGIVMGTMSYCAPEQFHDASHVDLRADIYSLGCTLYHLLVGKSPYSQRKTFAEIVQAHLHEPFPIVTDVLSDAPAGLNKVLMQMTSKDRCARYSTLSEVATALEPFARGAALAALVPPATPQSPSRRVGSGKPSPTPYQRGAIGKTRSPVNLWKRRAALIALIGAIAGGVALYLDQAGSKIDIRMTLMDTKAPRGIYDENNKNTGRSNAEEVYDFFKEEFKEIPSENIDVQSVGFNWGRRDQVRLHRPHLVIVHRSVFYHPVAAFLGFPYPDQIRSNHVDQAKIEAELKLFDERYKLLGDDPLRAFLGYIGKSNPHTKFLIYSRGTDPKWLDGDFREKWKQEIEKEYPDLEGRIWLMVVPGGLKEGSFRNQDAREMLATNVTTILKLPTRAK